MKSQQVSFFIYQKSNLQNNAFVCQMLALSLTVQADSFKRSIHFLLGLVQASFSHFIQMGN